MTAGSRAHQVTRHDGLVATAGARWLLRQASDNGVLVWLLVAIVAAWATSASEFFLTLRNLANLSGQLVPVGFAALGQVCAILVGAIDLSVGATARMSALLTAGLINDDPTRVLWVPLVVLAGAAVIGAVNALIVVKLRVEPLIATLITYTLLRGVALLYTTEPIGGIPFEQARFAQTVVLWLPYPAWLLLGAAAALGIVLGRTRFGRTAYAVGGDQEVARRAGIDVPRVRATMLVLCSVLAGAAGIVLAFRQGVGEPRVAEGLELDAIVAVVIGGVSIFGGRGRVAGVLGGVVLLAVLRNAMSLQSVDGLLQGVVTGLLIIVAIVVFSRRER
jgi:ribose transport system permease protein